MSENKRSFKLLWATRTFNKRRQSVYKNLAFGLSHDASPGQEVKTMLRTAKARRSALEPIYEDWDDQLRNETAGNLSKAMKRTIPAGEYSLLASAEETNNLQVGFQFLADTVARVEEMESSIREAFRKTWLPIAMLLFMFYGTDVGFFPMLEDSLERKAWPLLTKIVASIAHEIAFISMLGVVVIPAGLGLWYYLLPRWTGAGRKIAEKTIAFSKYRDYQCALFLVKMAFLMEAGHAVRESLERIYKFSDQYMKFHLDIMLTNLNTDATNAGDAITSSGLFSEEIGDMLANYARWSNWHEKIREISDSGLRIVTEDVKRLGPKVESFLTLVIGLCIMLIFAAGAVATLKVFMSTGLR